MLERMATLYEQHGQPDAALLLRIDRLNLLRNDTYENGSLAQNPLFAQYLELAQKNADNPLNVRTYNALTEWNYDADSPSRGRQRQFACDPGTQGPDPLRPRQGNGRK